jgi:anti-sigma factor ChrR (cupin superfamily)
VHTKELEELAALDAVGALGAEEQQALRARLAHATAEERALVAPLYDLAADLAMASAAGATRPGRSEAATVAPRAAVKRRLMAAVTGSGMYFLRDAASEWLPSRLPGIRIKKLSADVDRGTAMLLMHVSPGARYPGHHHSGGEDCYVISGDVTIQGQRLEAGDFHHADGNSDHVEQFSENGAVLLLVVAASDYANDSWRPARPDDWDRRCPSDAAASVSRQTSGLTRRVLIALRARVLRRDRQITVASGLDWRARGASHQPP